MAVEMQQLDGMTAATQEQEAPSQQARINKRGTICPQGYDELERFCKTIMQSQLIPSGFSNSADVMVAVQSGEALGMTPMQSVQSLNVINGTPTLKWATMLAMCQRSPLFDHSAFEISETGTFPEDSFAMHVTVRRRQENCKPFTQSFSISDAKTAGLWSRESKAGKAMPWKSYPKRMLMISAGRTALKNIFADVLCGVECREVMIDSLLDQIDTRPAFDPNKTKAETLTDILKAKREETQAPSPSADDEARSSDSGSPDPAAASPTDAMTKRIKDSKGKAKPKVSFDFDAGGGTDADTTTAD